MKEKIPKDIIRLSYLDSLFQKVHDFNQLNLADIILLDDKNKYIDDKNEYIVFSPKILDEWKVIGLSNKSFIELRYWVHDKHIKSTQLKE